MLCTPQRALKNVILFAVSVALPSAASAMTVGNPLCPGEEVSFNPDNGQDIGLPDGFKVSVFAKGLNFPTGIAFRGNSHRFEVYVLESGAFPASRCNNGAAWQANGLPGNPFTPDVVVFDQNAKPLRTLGPTRRAAAPTRSSRVVRPSTSRSSMGRMEGGSSRPIMGQMAVASRFWTR